MFALGMLQAGFLILAWVFMKKAIDQKLVYSVAFHAACFGFQLACVMFTGMMLLR